MKIRSNSSILFLALSAIVMIAGACGGSYETTSAPTVGATSTTSAYESEPETSSQTITDATPVPGSTDGTFVVSDGSEATFTVNEKLSRLPLPSDAVLRTGAISGEIDLSAESASLVIDLHSLESDESRRDDYVKDRLFPSQPTATISVSDFPDIPEIFANGESFTSTVVATVNVNGVDAEIEFEIESRLDPDRLLVLVKGDFKWADFGMTAPTSRFFVVNDDVHVEVLVSAVPD